MRARSMKVIDLAVRHVECIHASATVRDCAKAMRTRHVGSLVVVDEERHPLGVITDRDIAIETVALDRDPDAATAREAMTSPAIVAEEEESIVDALARMRECGIRRLPVVNEEGVLTGVVTNSNLLEEMAAMMDSLVRSIRSSKTREAAQRP